MPAFKKKDAADKPAVSPMAGAEDIRKKVSRLGIATAACAVVAAGAVGFAAIDHTTSANQLSTITGNMAEVAVAVDTINAGTTITGDMLTMVAVPATYISSGATNNPAAVVGHKAIVDIEANSQIRASEVGGADEGASLAAKVEEGEKAVTIDTSAASAYAQKLLRQGDHCTLYAFTDAKVTSALHIKSDSATLTVKGGKQKVVLAKDAEILALDGFTSYADMKAAGVEGYSAVTFQVSKSQAEKIRMLQDMGVTVWPVITAASDVDHDTAADSAEPAEADLDAQN